MTALHSGQHVPPCPTVNRTKHVRHMVWLHGSSDDGPLCSQRQMGHRVFIVQWYFNSTKKTLFFSCVLFCITPPADPFGGAHFTVGL